MARNATSIDLSGPFFTNDPRKTFRQNARVMLARLAEEGEQDVRVQQQASESTRAPISNKVTPDRVSGHVVGRVTALSGKRWALTAVVSVNNRGQTEAGGIALMAAASRVEERTRAFRRTTYRLRKARAINAAELLKGIG